MTKIGGYFIFEVEDLLVARESLGRAIKISRGDIVVRVDLPKERDDFDFAVVRMSDDAGRDNRTAWTGRESDDYVNVSLLRAVANADSELSAADWDEQDPQLSSTYESLRTTMFDTASAVVADLIDQIKLTGRQLWIAPRGEYPSCIYESPLVDLTTETSFGSQIAKGGTLLIFDGADVLTPAVLDQIETLLNAGVLEADEALLAEAMHLTWDHGETASSRAVLLAAIAVELSVQRGLRVLATAESRAYVELLLENPRDWSMGAHGLFSRALPVVAGRDLGDEHKELARRVQRLFEARNRVAHRGGRVNRDDARLQVATATGVHDFLGRLLAERALERADHPGDEASHS